jgi:hypothetical protein
MLYPKIILLVLNAQFATTELEYRACQIDVTDGTVTETAGVVRAQVESCSDLTITGPFEATDPTTVKECCWQVNGQWICVSIENDSWCGEWAVKPPCNPWCEAVPTDDCCSVDSEGD